GSCRFSPDTDDRRLPQNADPNLAIGTPAGGARGPFQRRIVADDEDRMAVRAQNTMVLRYYSGVERSHLLRPADLLAERRIGDNAVNGRMRQRQAGRIPATQERQTKAAQDR